MKKWYSEKIKLLSKQLIYCFTDKIGYLSDIRQKQRWVVNINLEVGEVRVETENSKKYT